MEVIHNPIKLIIIPTIAINPSQPNKPKDITKIPILGIAFPKTIGKEIEIEQKNAKYPINFSPWGEQRIFSLGTSNFSRKNKTLLKLLITAAKCEVLMVLLAIHLGKDGFVLPETIWKDKYSKGKPNIVVNPGGVGIGKVIGREKRIIKMAKPLSLR